MSEWSPTVTESLAKVWVPDHMGLGQIWSPEVTWDSWTGLCSGFLTNLCDLWADHISSLSLQFLTYKIGISSVFSGFWYR